MMAKVNQPKPFPHPKATYNFCRAPTVLLLFGFDAHRKEITDRKEENISSMLRDFRNYIISSQNCDSWLYLHDKEKLGKDTQIATGA